MIVQVRSGASDTHIEVSRHGRVDLVEPVVALVSTDVVVLGDRCRLFGETRRGEGLRGHLGRLVEQIGCRVVVRR